MSKLDTAAASVASRFKETKSAAKGIFFAHFFDSQIWRFFFLWIISARS